MATQIYDFTNPVDVDKALSDDDWGYQTVDGKISFWFCTQCSAAVPAQTTPSAKIHHKNYHIAIAHAVSTLREELVQLRNELGLNDA